MFDFTYDMVSVMDEDGCFMYANPAWAKQLGWSVEALLDTPCLNYVHPQDRKRTQAQMNQLQDAEVARIRFKNRCRTRAGRWRLLSWTGVGTRSGLWTAVCQDVTSEIEVDTDPEPAPAGLVDSSNLAAHELKDRLSSLAIRLQLIGKTLPDAQAQEHLAGARRNIEAMRRISKRLHHAALLERNAAPAAATSLSEVAQEAAALVAGRRRRARIEVQELPTCFIDAGYAGYLFQNLLGTAVTHSRGRPRITVRADASEIGMARIVVAGPRLRIPDAERHALDPSTTSAAGPHLEVCRRIARRFGGDLRLAADARGLEVVLPVAAP